MSRKNVKKLYGAERNNNPPGLGMWLFALMESPVGLIKLFGTTTHTLEKGSVLAKTKYLFLLYVGQYVANCIFLTSLVLVTLFESLCMQSALSHLAERLDFVHHKLVWRAHY